ncbi:hypothetical protein [Streptomyces sp. NPDC020362]|uniref:EF-Tu C-terminal domain-related protein n=1 Tax=unclassified Streptomyces TaxID=2593676 RepID=UPI000A754720
MTAVEQPFLFVVEDVFTRNQGRAVAAAGVIVRGRVHSGADVSIVGSGRNELVPVTGIEVDKHHVDEAITGMNVALLLPGKSAVERGHVLAAPGSIGAHQSFRAEVSVLPEAQGGFEVRTGDHLAFYIHSGAMRGVVTLPTGLDALRPTHLAAVTVTLERPVALEVGQHFAFRHRGRAAGSGRVSELLCRGS